MTEGKTIQKGEKVGWSLSPYWAVQYLCWKSSVQVPNIVQTYIPSLNLLEAPHPMTKLEIVEATLTRPSVKDGITSVGY